MDPFYFGIYENKLIGFQFHPEKSGETGLKLLKTTIKEYMKQTTGDYGLPKSFILHQM